VPPAGEGSALALAAQAAASRVAAAAAQQRKGERVLGFSAQKTVLPLGI